MIEFTITITGWKEDEVYEDDFRVEASSATEALDKAAEVARSQGVEIGDCNVASRRPLIDHAAQAASALLSGNYRAAAEHGEKALAPPEHIKPVAPKARKGFQYAGPAPDGTFISRKTDNDYSHAVAVISQVREVYKPRDPKAVNGYVPNPSFGKYVGISWHSRQDLAIKKAQQLRDRGYKGVTVLRVVVPA